MSEELLRALIDQFALIVKQDGGMLPEEMNFCLCFPYQAAYSSEYPLVHTSLSEKHRTVKQE